MFDMGGKRGCSVAVFIIAPVPLAVLLSGLINRMFFVIFTFKRGGNSLPTESVTTTLGAKLTTAVASNRGLPICTTSAFRQITMHP